MPAPCDPATYAACTELINRATYLMDHHHADEFAELFTADGTFLPPAEFPDGQAMMGREAIREALRSRPKSLITRHICSNIRVECADEGSAVVTHYFTHFRATLPEGKALPIPIEETLRSVGEYRDELVYLKGSWMIARRTAQFVLGHR